MNKYEPKNVATIPREQQNPGRQGSTCVPEPHQKCDKCGRELPYNGGYQRLCRAHRSLKQQSKRLRAKQKRTMRRARATGTPVSMMTAAAKETA